MDSAVIVKDLTVKFNGKAVLNQLSLSLKAGEIVGLIGPSGAGKSTLINALLGMIKVNSGSVEVFGHEMPNREVMSQIGFMAQSDALFGELTGEQNLEFLEVYRESPKKS